MEGKEQLPYLDPCLNWKHRPANAILEISTVTSFIARIVNVVAILPAPARLSRSVTQQMILYLVKSNSTEFDVISRVQQDALTSRQPRV